jgi:hypothetical protein
MSACIIRNPNPEPADFHSPTSGCSASRSKQTTTRKAFTDCNNPCEIEYSQICPNSHLPLTVICVLRPLSFCFSAAHPLLKQSVLNGHLSYTSTIFWSRGWPLTTYLAAQLIYTLQHTHTHTHTHTDTHTHTLQLHTITYTHPEDVRGLPRP